MIKATFNNKNKIFFRTINDQVTNYFTSNNIKKTGNNALYLKSFLLITAALLTYLIIITMQLPMLVLALLCCLFGLLQAGIGFNVMHDANHGTFSDKKWLNYMMGLTSNVMGVNAWFWKQKHNIIHHTYTNVDGIDDDIFKPPFLRMCDSQKRMKIHRYQNLYCIPLYTLSSLLMFATDFSKYFKKKILATKLQKMNLAEHLLFWASKLFYVFFFIIVPVYVFGFLPTIIGFALMHATLGVTLGLVFQLAHVVEITHFEDASQHSLKIENEWAIHQVKTTADFATNNKFISWFTGGLNYQVEHHLYPKISHIHYPVIRKFVMEACQKYSVPYNHYPTMTSALISHLRFLKKLGTKQATAI